MNAKMTKAKCSGCEQNFYNGNNPYNVKECWSFKTATVQLRRRICMSDIPPWNATPEALPSCYHQRGYSFGEI